MSSVAQKIFEKNKIAVDVKTGLSEDEIVKIIPEYDGMVVRSATKVTKKIIEAAKNLKVIGRAGAGVDNIDVPAAKEKNMKTIVLTGKDGGHLVNIADIISIVPYYGFADRIQEIHIKIIHIIILLIEQKISNQKAGDKNHLK